jgi:hypothetical protein
MAITSLLRPSKKLFHTSGGWSEYKIMEDLVLGEGPIPNLQCLLTMPSMVEEAG